MNELQVNKSLEGESYTEPGNGTPPWMLAARCRELSPGEFFPSDGGGVEMAKRICRECVVQEPCLDYALEHRIDDGVWGGTSERERRRILKARKLNAGL